MFRTENAAGCNEILPEVHTPFGGKGNLFYVMSVKCLNGVRGNDQESAVSSTKGRYGVS